MLKTLPAILLISYFPGSARLIQPDVVKAPRITKAFFRAQEPAAVRRRALSEGPDKGLSVTILAEALPRYQRDRFIGMPLIGDGGQPHRRGTPWALGGVSQT